jgi:hypothetical protein
MDPTENSRAVAEELVFIGQQQELDLAPFCTDGFFQKNRRWIFFWRKDELPSSGRADEAMGTLHYNMQGVIAALPGMWSEAGTFENIEQALELLKAWLFDRNEPDHLPQRQVRRAGFG